MPHENQLGFRAEEPVLGPARFFIHPGQTYCRALAGNAVSEQVWVISQERR
jgi:hypothetical protein